MREPTSQEPHAARDQVPANQAAPQSSEPPHQAQDSTAQKLLAPTIDFRGPDRVAHLRGEQRERWRRGDRVLVEAYLEGDPDLKADEESVLSLLYYEFL